MKIKLLLTLLVFTLSFSSVYASFPVVKTTSTQTAITNNVNLKVNQPLTSPAAAMAGKSMTTALLLWFFLGGFAAHRWYLGSPWYWNILFIITLGGLLVWSIIDLIDIITEKYPGL